MNDAFKELADFCHESKDLSLPLLLEKLEAGPNGIVRGNLLDEVEDDTTLLHYACYNRRVTLGIVRHLVSLYPEAVKVRTDYGWLPLHRACNNAACPDEVVKYLVGLFPDALGVPWPSRGLPLHCLLSRRTTEEEEMDGTTKKKEEVRRRLNLDLVRMLVEAYPDALTNQDSQTRMTPLLCACERDDVSMDMVQLLVDSDLSVLGIGGGYGDAIPLEVLMKQYSSAEAWHPPFDVVRFFVESAPETITPSILNKICGSRNITLEIVQLVIENRPDVSFLDQVDGNRMLPLHSLCLNDNKKDQDSWLLPIIQYVVNLYPRAVREVNNYGMLPVSYAVRTTLEITKFLVEEYPESVSVSLVRGSIFHDACRSGGIETVKYLYEKNPLAIKSVNYPALHLPFESGRDVDAKLDFLLEEHPQSIRAKDPSNGDLALHAACFEYSWKLSRIKKVFELYPDAVATRNHEGRFPLHEFLAQHRHINEFNKDTKGKEALETVLFLATQFPFSVRVADEDGMLPLHHASKSYHLDIVVYLAQAYPHGVKVDSLKFGLPLHCASGRHRDGQHVIGFLLALYPEAIVTRNETVGLPIECTNNKDIFVYLMKRYTTKAEYALHHVLQDSALLNPVSVVRVFLQHYRGNVNQIDNLGRYPLHLAVSSARASHFVVKEFLTFHKAAAVHQDKQGCNPLHYFFRHSASMEASVSEEILSELLSSGFNSVKTPDHSGSLPLHFACRYGAETNTFVTLIESFPEAVRVGDRKGCIPLHVACRRGALPVDTLRRLVAYDNTTIQTADKDLELPLHKACRGGHFEIINYLLDEYAPASSMRNASGSLPIHILCRKSGKADISIMDAPVFTETVFRLLRAHPEAVMP